MGGTPVEPSGNLVPLRDFVAALRSELLAAHNDGLAPGSDENSPRFVVGPVNIEFTVTAKKDAEAKGGVRFYVFELGASGSVGTESTQRVSLTLTPVTKDNDPYDVADQMPFRPK
jgi:hypothetical protein